MGTTHAAPRTPRAGRRPHAGAAAAHAPDLLFCEARAALGQGDAGLANDLLARLCRLLEAHFSLEDRVYFPALQALAPGLADELRLLAGEHVWMLEALEATRAAVERSDAATLVRDLDEVAILFAEHEQREDAILHRIEKLG